MDIEQKILTHLQDKYNPEVVILHGSRAAQKNRENSDWDLYVFTKTTIEGVSEEFAGQSLDVHVVYLPLDGYDFIDLFGTTLVNAKILLDTDNFAKKLIEEAKEIYVQGRILTNAEFSNRKNYIFRLLQKLKGTVNKPLEFFYRLGSFYEIAVRYWFEVQGKWSQPIYEALPTIQSEDSEYFGWLVMLSQNISEEIKMDVAQKIFLHLCNLNTKNENIKSVS